MHGFQECLPRAFWAPEKEWEASFWEDQPGGRESTCSAWPRGWAVNGRAVWHLCKYEAGGGFDKLRGNGRRSHHFWGACSFILFYWPLLILALKASPSSLRTFACAVSLSRRAFFSLHFLSIAHPSDFTWSSMFLGKPSLTLPSRLNPPVWSSSQCLSQLRFYTCLEIHCLSAQPTRL